LVDPQKFKTDLKNKINLLAENPKINKLQLRPKLKS